MTTAARILIAILLALPSCLAANAQEQLSIGNTPVDMPTAESPKAPGPSFQDAGWHLDLSPYLWFPGVHGTVGALGRDVGIHVSPGDLLSHFDIGLMAAAEARRQRLLLAGDLLWARFSNSQALPFPGLSAVSADARVGQFIWTSKIGYRLIAHKGLNADANVGVRFWHLGQQLNFNPSSLGLSLNASQNWADIVVGGRVQIPLSPWLALDVRGDVGGWNATANSDYQFGAILGYKLSSRWALFGGYRYLFVDYRPGKSAVYNMTMPGAIFGATYRLK